MALPFIMLAVLFRGIENFKMFDMVNLLTGGGPGSTTEVASITLKREAFEKLAHRLFLGLRHHPVRRGVRPRQHLRQGAEQGEAAMSADHRPFGRRADAAIASCIAGAIVVALCADLDVPLLWIFATSFKTPPDSIAYPPKIALRSRRSRATATCSRRARGRRRNTSSSLPPATTLLRRDSRASATW